MLNVRAVEHFKDYQLMLTFSDGSQRIIDLKEELHGEIFEPLRDLDYFKQVKVNSDIDTIVWPNDADFAPEYLYEKSKPVEQISRRAA